VDRWLEILTKREILFRGQPLTCRVRLWHALHGRQPMRCCPRRKSGWAPARQYLEQAGERQASCWRPLRTRRRKVARHSLAGSGSQQSSSRRLAETLARIERAVNLGAAGENCVHAVIESHGEVLAGRYAEAERAQEHCLQRRSDQIGCSEWSLNGLGPQAKYDEVATLSRPGAASSA